MRRKSHPLNRVARLFAAVAFALRAARGLIKLQRDGRARTRRRRDASYRAVSPPPGLAASFYDKRHKSTYNNYKVLRSLGFMSDDLVVKPADVLNPARIWPGHDRLPQRGARV